MTQQQTFFAHSGYILPDGRIMPGQQYAEHIRRVMLLARANAVQAASYLSYAAENAARSTLQSGAGNLPGCLAESASEKAREALMESLTLAAERHDLGKLIPENAATLACNPSSEARKKLPVNHVNAGRVSVLDNVKAIDFTALHLIHSHHGGLENYSDLKEILLKDHSATDSVKKQAAECLRLHNREMGVERARAPGRMFEQKGSVDWRIALSCLVDADHEDTAQFYAGHCTGDHTSQQAQAEPAPVLLRASERLAALKSYVARINENCPQTPRNALRQELFTAALEAPATPGLASCDSPVGSGKTTSVMAHLLHVAGENGLRRIFVVLPYTSIIDQSVEIYRKALVLEGEDPELVVAAHHHRAEFSAPASRAMTMLWRAPIIVVTAVQFFQTLAAASPSALRKLHTLPGSAVFMDEAHAAMPLLLWLPAWSWLCQLQQRWGCHFVFGSGSLPSFWSREEFREVERLCGLAGSTVRELFPASLRERAAVEEKQRVRYIALKRHVSMETLARCVLRSPGPRLVVCNTVRVAAALAKLLQSTGQSVEHLSTALCPRDRGRTIERVKERLKNAGDNDWTLVATSCVEAGVDFSFRTGFRERFGLCNLLQLAGRICRNAECLGTIFDFVLLEQELPGHPKAKTPAEALRGMFMDGLVGPEHCTEAMRRELGLIEPVNTPEMDIAKKDAAYGYKYVEEHFKIIDSDTVTVLVDQGIIKQLAEGELVSPRHIQETSVQIWSNRVKSLPVRELENYPGLLVWTGRYDAFLGYLADENY